jgi:hypothetical protein
MQMSGSAYLSTLELVEISYWVKSPMTIQALIQMFDNSLFPIRPF